MLLPPGVGWGWVWIKRGRSTAHPVRVAVTASGELRVIRKEFSNRQVAEVSRVEGAPVKLFLNIYAL